MDNPDTPLSALIIYDYQRGNHPFVHFLLGEALFNFRFVIGFKLC